jgi:hypothetical protein
MRTVTAPATSRKPRSKPARSIRLDLTPGQHSPGVVTIAVGKLAKRYFLDTIPSDWGRAFRLEEIGTDGECPYFVCLDDSTGHHQCNCLGFLRHGHCKHVAGLRALLAAGKLS